MEYLDQSPDVQTLRNLMDRFLRNASNPDLSPGQRAYWQRLYDQNKDRYPVLQEGVQ